MAIAIYQGGNYPKSLSMPNVRQSDNAGAFMSAFSQAFQITSAVMDRAQKAKEEREMMRMRSELSNTMSTGSGYVVSDEPAVESPKAAATEPAAEPASTVEPKAAANTYSMNNRTWTLTSASNPEVLRQSQRLNAQRTAAMAQGDLPAAVKADWSIQALRANNVKLFDQVEQAATGSDTVASRMAQPYSEAVAVNNLGRMGYSKLLSAIRDDSNPIYWKSRGMNDPGARYQVAVNALGVQLEPRDQLEHFENMGFSDEERGVYRLTTRVARAEGLSDPAAVVARSRELLPQVAQWEKTSPGAVDQGIQLASLAKDPDPKPYVELVRNYGNELVDPVKSLLRLRGQFEVEGPADRQATEAQAASFTATYRDAKGYVEKDAVQRNALSQGYQFDTNSGTFSVPKSNAAVKTSLADMQSIAIDYAKSAPEFRSAFQELAQEKLADARAKGGSFSSTYKDLSYAVRKQLAHSATRMDIVQNWMESYYPKPMTAPAAPSTDIKELKQYRKVR